VKSSPIAGEVGGGFGEEELEGGGEFGEVVEGDDEWLGEGGGDPLTDIGDRKLCDLLAKRFKCLVFGR
jgi:hypothetical protein